MNKLVNMADGLHGVLAPVEYSTRWEFGGTIIDRSLIALEPMTHDEHGDGWLATRGEGSNIYMEFGHTALIAAMRCYVASKLGDFVTIPEE